MFNGTLDYILIYLRLRCRPLKISVTANDIFSNRNAFGNAISDLPLVHLDAYDDAAPLQRSRLGAAGVENNEHVAAKWAGETVKVCERHEL